MKGNRTFSDIITLRSVFTLIHSLTLIVSAVLMGISNFNEVNNFTSTATICWFISVIIMAIIIGDEDCDDISHYFAIGIEATLAIIILFVLAIIYIFNIELTTTSGLFVIEDIVYKSETLNEYLKAILTSASAVIMGLIWSYVASKVWRVIKELPL